jgi:hypothetical protein
MLLWEGKKRGLTAEAPGAALLDEVFVVGEAYTFITVVHLLDNGLVEALDPLDHLTGIPFI